MDKYTVSTIKKMDTATMTATEIKAKMDESNMHKEMYKNPFWVIALTYMEVLIPIDCWCR